MHLRPYKELVDFGRSLPQSAPAPAPPARLVGDWGRDDARPFLNLPAPEMLERLSEKELALLFMVAAILDPILLHEGVSVSPAGDIYRALRERAHGTAEAVKVWLQKTGAPVRPSLMMYLSADSWGSERPMEPEDAARRAAGRHRRKLRQALHDLRWASADCEGDLRVRGIQEAGDFSPLDRIRWFLQSDYQPIQTLPPQWAAGFLNVLIELTDHERDLLYRNLLGAKKRP